MFLLTTPLMLLGLAAVAVPVALHLLMQQQPRHLEFPALRFIRQRQDVNRRRLRLRHLLLLLLRAGAIALLAVALARPVFYSSGFFAGGQAPLAAALVFDTTPRMEYRHQNQTRLAAAQSAAQSLLSQLPSECDVVVLDSQHVRSDFDLDRSTAGQRVEQLAAAPGGRPLVEVFDQAIALLRKSQRPRKEVHILTDLARTQWDGDQTLAWQKRLRENPEIAVYVIDVGVAEPQDFALGQIDLSNQVISQNGVLQVYTELVREGPAGERVVRLYLSDPEGKPQLKSEGTFACQADSAAQVEFSIGALPLGTHQGYVEIAEDDALKIDNRRYFSVRIAPPWSMLIVAPRPAASHALAVTDVFAPALLQQHGQAEFECDTADYAALGDLELSRYDAVWLLDPPPLADTVWRRLADYVVGGRHLMLALGGQAGPAGERFNTAAAEALLPARLNLLINTGGDEVYLAPDRLEHPIFALLKDSQGTISWHNNPVFKYWDLGPLDESAQVLARYGNGRPAVIEQPFGQGRVLTLTTSLVESTERPWNALLLRDSAAWPGFALVWGIGQHMVGRVDEQTNYLVGEVAELRLDKGELFDSYLLTTPLGDTVKMREEGGILRFDDTKSIGQYQLRAGGERDVRRGFSVNLPPSATRLSRMDQEAMAKAFEGSQLQIARSSEELARQRRAGEAKSQWELYPWLALVVALVIVGENLLASLFYRRGGDEVSVRRVKV